MSFAQPRPEYEPAPESGVRAADALAALGRGAAWIGAVLLGLVAIAGVLIAAYAAWLFHDLPNAGDLADYRPPTSTRVYAWDGTLIGEFGKERRIFVPYDQIPPQLIRAFLSAEDNRFFSHGGIDVQGLGRAFSRDAVSLVQGKRLQGGSTITQQVAKNVLLNGEQSFGRKLKEAILARRLEQTLSKERILELYLNEIWLGNHSYGVAMAAYNYFGKPLNQLTLEEMAYLASLPKGPANYDPVRRKTAAIGRRNWVLGQMVENGWATAPAARYAMGQDLVTQARPQRAAYKDADYFMEEVRQRAVGTIGKDAEESGLYIRTTLDSRLQTAARVALMAGLERYDRRHGWRGAWGHTDLQPGWEKAAQSKSPASERRAWRAAAVDRASGGGVHVILPSGGAGEIDGADVAWARAGRKPLEVGDLVFVEPREGGKVFDLRQTPIVNGALVAIEPHTGKVLALVGGYSFSLSNFNRATQAMRQPGSAFKPFVYATALENGFTPASIVLDAPISLPGANGSTWSPENFEHDSAGPQPFRNGLVYSRNQMTVRIAQATGMKKIVDAAKRDGVVDSMAPVLAMALGAGETTPFRLTAAYAAFANGGRRIEPHLIEEATDRSGKPVWRADARACPRCDAAYAGQDSPRVDPPGAQVMDPVTAYAMTLMLQGVVQNGTAAAAGAALGRPLAGKTGTTNSYRSAWFVGYSPDLVVGTFVGFDDNRSLGDRETGAVDAVPIFIDFMKDALKGVPVTDFVAPSNAKIVSVHGHNEAFRPGTEPKPRPVQAPEAAALIGADGKPVGGPIPYGKLNAPAAAPPPPEPKTAPQDLNGLY